MTENEAIRQLKYMYKTCMNEQCRHKGQCDLCYEAREIANKALEEIQQYRALGTVEEVKNAYAKGYNQGTIDRAEEITKAREYGYNKAIDEYMNALCDKCMDMKNECYQLECPFCSDGCDIVNIAERLKAGGE